MSSKQLGSGVLVGALMLVGVAAVIDTVRSNDPTNRPQSRPASANEEDGADPLVATLSAEGIRGVIYYSDPEDDCRVRAVELPTLVEVPPPKLRACRFELPRDPGTGAALPGVTWDPGGRLAAACVGGRVTVMSQTGAPLRIIKGCAPAWMPNGRLAVIRNGEVWSVRRPCSQPSGCDRKLLARSDLSRAARLHPIVPEDPRYLERVVATKVAALESTRFVVLVQIRLRGRLRGLGPQPALAFYEGRRLLALMPYTGAKELRVSPSRRLIAVQEAQSPASIFTRSGRRVAATSPPLGDALTIAWSPNEQWTAIATRWSVFLVRTSDLLDGRELRTIRLPLAARDLAWR